MYEWCNWLLDLYGTTDPATFKDGNTQTGRHWDSFGQFHDLLTAGYPAAFHYLIPDDTYAGYIQDTWKARPNLTINGGMRYDLQYLASLPNSVAQNLGILPAGSMDLPIFDKYTTTYPNEYDGIQPRLGAAWNIAKDTVIRFSAGEFFAKTEGHNVK